jgi:hypothetical protein
MPNEPTVNSLIVDMLKQLGEENTREHREIMEAGAEERARLREANESGHKQIMACVKELDETVKKQNSRIGSLEDSRKRIGWMIAGGSMVGGGLIAALAFILKWLVPLVEKKL